MSTLRHSYGDSVILASLKTSVPETKISVIWRSHRYKKKLRLFLVIKRENSREYLCHFTLLFLRWTHSGLWLATTRDHPCFTRLHSRPSFQTMATPTGKLDVSQTDVSPKKIQIQKKPHRYLTMAGRVGVTGSDAIQQRRIKETVFQGNMTLLVVGTGRYAHGCPAKFPL